MKKTDGQENKVVDVTVEEANAFQADVLALQAKHNIGLNAFMEYLPQGIVPRIGLVKIPSQEVPVQEEVVEEAPVEEVTAEPQSEPATASNESATA